MNNHTIGSRSGPPALEVGTYWPGASTGDVPARVQRSESILPLLRAGLLLALVFGIGAASTFPAAGQVASNPSGGTTQTNFAALTNAILFEGIWYNPAFFPPPPTVPGL
jgi:hypothetical protein